MITTTRRSAMLGHMIAIIKPKTATADQAVHHSPTRDHSREQIISIINELHALSRRGLWGILSFLALSAMVLYASTGGLFSLVPVEVKEMFGDPPPLHLLHIALGVSWLSAFILILGRRSADGKPCYSWYNIGLPTAFYPLYIFSDPACANFPAVFAAGLLLLIIEHATVMTYAAKAIREETSRLNRLQE
jgi:hypothetical protein